MFQSRVRRGKPAPGQLCGQIEVRAEGRLFQWSRQDFKGLSPHSGGGDGGGGRERNEFERYEEGKIDVD